MMRGNHELSIETKCPEPSTKGLVTPTVTNAQERRDVRTLHVPAAGTGVSRSEA